MAQNYMRIASEWPVIQAKNETGFVFDGIGHALRVLAGKPEDPDDAETQAPISSRVPLDEISIGNDASGWHDDDEVIHTKLMASLQRHGQVRPLIVRRDTEQGMVIIDGHALFRAIKALGWANAMVTDLGMMDEHEATQLALDLETHREISYAKLPTAISNLLTHGETPSTLAASSPFTAERITQLATHAKWSWDQIHARVRLRKKTAGSRYRHSGAGTYLLLPPVRPRMERRSTS
jgi:hypothetical protein